MPWGNIVDDVYRLDAQATYTRLVEGLSLGNEATSYGAVVAALDAAERNAFDAVRLFRAAKLEEQSVEADYNEQVEVLRSNAREEINKENDARKEKKLTTKAPTLQDISDRIVANWPSKFRELGLRKDEFHGATRAMEELASIWRSRCASLRVIMERVAPVRA